MTETDIYQPIVGGLLSDGHVVFKIVDGSAGKKPFDIAGISSEGQGIGLEVKAASRDREAIGPDWRLFRSHQITWLRAYARAGAIALVVQYCKETHRLSIWRMNTPSDRCTRPADLVLTRDSEKLFTGWTKVIQKEDILDG